MSYDRTTHNKMKKRPSDFAEMAIFLGLRKEFMYEREDDTFCDFAER
jgi:hypothetical protein